MFDCTLIFLKTKIFSELFVKGVRGKYCERLLKQNEDLCGSSPCWNGGTCLSNKTNWICVCPGKNKAYDCRNNYGRLTRLIILLSYDLSKIYCR